MARIGRRLAAGAMCLLSALPIHAGVDADADVLRVLASLDGDAQGVDEVADALVELAAPAIEPLLGCLVTERLPATRSGEQAGAPLTSDQRTAILAAFESLPTRAVRSSLRAAIRANTDPQSLLVAVEVYGACGTAEDLGSIVRAVDSPSISPELGEHLQSTVHSILVRDPRAHNSSVDLVRNVDRAVLPFLVRAIGAAGSRAGLPALLASLDALGFREDEPMERAVLEALTALASINGPLFDVDALAHVRRRLDHGDSRVVEAALKALSALEDVESVPRLIELMDAGAPLASRAYEALKAISGEDFARTRPMWRAWFELQSSWYEERAIDLFDRLGASDSTVVAAAVLELVGHPFFRHEIAAELTPLTEHEDPRLRRLACAALGQLRSPVALPALEEAHRRNDSDPEATEALRVLRTPLN